MTSLPSSDSPDTTPAVADDVETPDETVETPADEAVETAADAAPVTDEPVAETAADDSPAAEETPSTEAADEAGEPDAPAADAEESEASATAEEPEESEASPTAEEPEESEASPTAEEPEAPVAAPKATPAPGPRPGPRPGARVAAPVEPWGRVDEDGTVSVREGAEWRVVGQYPDGTPDEALAYYTRKFADLAGEVTLLEVRHRRGGASASDLRSTAATVRAKVDGAAAVGDLAALLERLDALTAELAEATETEAAAAKEAVDDAVRERTEIVEQAEALAARDPQSVQWKQMTTDMSALFDRWQAHQQNGPRLPKSTAQQLWRRFRDARATVDRHRREFFSALDETHKSARDAKTRLVERAEALAPRGEDGIPAYRDLLDEWKASGRAGRKVDDALWARFKAAGDALYGARIERETADAEASKEKIEQKRALLAEAAPIVDEKNLATARQKLTAIQRQWDEIGRIFPRDKERTLDDELRKIEQSVRAREDADWKRNDPEQKARANDMTRQLTDAIEKLEAELAAAQAKGDKRAAAQASEALEARRTWLRALGG
ncbi:polyhydroxyalkanoate synthesis regulator phasin [Microbacterium sp. SLBN-111]